MTASASYRRRMSGSVANILPISKLVQLADGELASGRNSFSVSTVQSAPGSSAKYPYGTTPQ